MLLWELTLSNLIMMEFLPVAHRFCFSQSGVFTIDRRCSQSSHLFYSPAGYDAQPLFPTFTYSYLQLLGEIPLDLWILIWRSWQIHPGLGVILLPIMLATPAAETAPMECGPVTIHYANRDMTPFRLL